MALRSCAGSSHFTNSTPVCVQATGGFYLMIAMIMQCGNMNK